MKIAVIVITKNRRKLLEQTLDSLFKNTPPELYDLIVLDDGSESTSYLKILHKMGKIKHLVLTNLGSLGALKNMGASIANTLEYDYVYQSDNDMYFLEGWLEECIETYESLQAVAIVSPYCHPFLQKNKDLDSESLCYNFDTIDASNGNSMFMSTRGWNNYKMQETKGIMASEDWEMSQRIRKDGGLCVKLRENKVLHCGITNSKGEPATGADIMLEDLSEAKIKYNLNLYYE